jgi:hypothetical protein
MDKLINYENNNEEYIYFNNILRLKDSIKSELIKKMLSEEDSKIKEDNNEIINKNIQKKKNNNINEKNNIYYPLKKIVPKSITIKNLLKERRNKKIKGNVKKKNIVKDENKNKNVDNKIKVIKRFKKNDNSGINNKTESKKNEIKDTIYGNFNDKLIDISNTSKRYFSPDIIKQKNILINYHIKEKDKNDKYYSEKKTERKKIFNDNELVIKKERKNKDDIEKTKTYKNSVYNEINQNLKNIINNYDIAKEKTIKDFELFLNENDSFEFNYSPKLIKTLNTFKKGNKFVKKYLYLPKYQKYSNEEIIKSLIYKNILSFLTPIEKYTFSKTNKESLVKYMKSKGSEAEILLDKYKNQKQQIEKILNKNQNIKVTKENFFNDNRLAQIFNLLNDTKYLEIFNDKSKIPDDNIIFVFKLFFLIIKGTDKLIDLKNDIFWEKISTYFINHTNEFNQNDYLLGELVRKILEQKLDFSEAKIQKIKDIIDQVDLRQINPNTFKDISPTTSQFCFIIGYFLEFFGIIDKEWNPLEIEYKELNQKINELIKKINKIGLYIVNLKYKNQFK